MLAFSIEVQRKSSWSLILSLNLLISVIAENRYSSIGLPCIPTEKTVNRGTPDAFGISVLVLNIYSSCWGGWPSQQSVYRESGLLVLRYQCHPVLIVVYLTPGKSERMENLSEVAPSLSVFTKPGNTNCCVDNSGSPFHWLLLRPFQKPPIVFMSPLLLPPYF